MRQRKHEFISPDLTPLIDVVFILLIFFLVTSVFKKKELSLLLNLPKSESGAISKQQQDIIKIEINETEMTLNGDMVDLNTLKQKVVEFNKDTPIQLRADAESKYKVIIEVFDILKSQNLNKISLITKKKNPEK